MYISFSPLHLLAPFKFLLFDKYVNVFDDVGFVILVKFGLEFTLKSPPSPLRPLKSKLPVKSLS